MTWAWSWSTIRSSSFLASISPPLLRFPLPPLPPWKQLCWVASQSRTRRMSSGGDGALSESPKINTHVSQIQGMLNGSPGKNNHTAAWFVIILSWCVLYRLAYAFHAWLLVKFMSSCGLEKISILGWLFFSVSLVDWVMLLQGLILSSMTSLIEWCER